MNPDPTRCKHDMALGQCGICHDRPPAPKHKYHRHIEGIDLSNMQVKHLDGDPNNHTLSNVAIVPIARAKVSLKPRRLNGRSSKRKG